MYELPQRSGRGHPHEDLGALLSRLLDVVVAREALIFEAHGLSMWEYVIVSRLAAHDGVTQKELAISSRRDPTRLGVNLDALTSRGLVDREVDATDRRRHLVRMTTAGRALLTLVRHDIAAMESSLTGGTSRQLRSALAAALTHVEDPDEHVQRDGRRE